MCTEKGNKVFGKICCDVGIAISYMRDKIYVFFERDKAIAICSYRRLKENRECLLILIVLSDKVVLVRRWVCLNLMLKVWPKELSALDQAFRRSQLTDQPQPSLRLLLYASPFRR